MPTHADINKVVKYTDGASKISFDGSSSGLEADNIQDAVDEALQRDNTILITDLPEATDVTDDDWLLVVDTAGAGPVLKKIKVSTLKAHIAT